MNLAFDLKSGRHAIAELAIAIHYNGSLNQQALENVRARRADYADFLPADKPVTGFQVTVGTGAPNVSHIQGGAVWQRFKADGSIGWVLTAQQDHVSANCLDYTTWVDVWPRLGGWLYDLHQQIEGAGHTATAISFQIIDQFIRKQPVTPPILRELFSDKSSFIPPRFFENGELWHLHQGWFDAPPAGLKGQKLTVLNLSADRSAVGNLVTIDHLMRVNLAAESRVLFNGKLEGSAFELAMFSLHEENKLTLANIITKEYSQAIGLVP